VVRRGMQRATRVWHKSATLCHHVFGPLAIAATGEPVGVADGGDAAGDGGGIPVAASQAMVLATLAGFRDAAGGRPGAEAVKRASSGSTL
jgi:hypothetical protein